MHGLKIGNKVKVAGKNGYMIGEVVNVYPDTFYINTDENFKAYIPYDSDWVKLPHNEKVEQKKRPKHYGNGKSDLIDFWFMRYSREELRGAIKSKLSKYADRLGYKDDEVSELNKIIDYATRYRDHLIKETETNEK